MKRAAVCGGEDLRDAARALGLEDVAERAEIVLVDASDDVAIGRALGLPVSLPRVFVADGARAALLESAGAARVVRPPVSAAAIGPLIHALERERRRAPSLVLCCSAVGASGRTSLVANLGLRVARHTPTVAIDGTGSGALAWRLGATVAPWADLAAVGTDLSDAHLRLAAADREGLLLVGGVGAPQAELLHRAIEVASAIGIVLLDAAAQRPTPALLEIADRVLVCANADAASGATTRGFLDELGQRDAQLVVSQADERESRQVAALFGRAPTFLLPRDERACRAALSDRGAIGGRLGRAYDAIAEILVAELLP